MISVPSRRFLPTRVAEELLTFQSQSVSIPWAEWVGSGDFAPRRTKYPRLHPLSHRPRQAAGELSLKQTQTNIPKGKKKILSNGSNTSKFLESKTRFCHDIYAHGMERESG